MAGDLAAKVEPALVVISDNYVGIVVSSRETAYTVANAWETADGTSRYGEFDIRIGLAGSEVTGICLEGRLGIPGSGFFPFRVIGGSAVLTETLKTATPAWARSGVDLTLNPKPGDRQVGYDKVNFT